MATRMNDTGARKQQILEKATALFAEKGYHGVGIDEIAKACGVVRGTVLKYFGTKQNLYRAVLYGRGNPAGDYMRAVCNDESIAVLDVLDELMEIAAQQFKSVIEYLRVDLDNEESIQNFDVIRLPVYRELQSCLEKIIERGNRDGVFHIDHPRIRAFSVMFAIFGITESLEGEAAMRTEMEAVINRMLKQGDDV